MENNILNYLVTNGTIKSYQYFIKNSHGEKNNHSEYGRNAECLIIEFNDGSKLTLDTFCSGSLQNTSLIMALN